MVMGEGEVKRYIHLRLATHTLDDIKLDTEPVLPTCETLLECVVPVRSFNCSRLSLPSLESQISDMFDIYLIYFIPCRAATDGNMTRRRLGSISNGIFHTLRCLLQHLHRLFSHNFTYIFTPCPLLLIIKQKNKPGEPADDSNCPLYLFFY